MTVRTKVIGRQPTDHGPYVSGQSYGKKYQVELYGCVWESKHDNNNTAPATLNTSTGVITPNTTDWKKVTGSYEQWLIDNGYQKLDASNVKDGNHTQHEVNAALAQSIDTEAARALAAEQGLQDDYDGLYALYQTLEGGSIIPVAAADWPVSNPQQNVIYRVANSATPTGYSDYMYNGTTTMLLATFSFPGIDSEPTPNSTNLVTSGGVASRLERLDRMVQPSDNLLGEDIDKYYPVDINPGDYFTVSTSDGNSFSVSGLQILTFNANKVQTDYFEPDPSSTYRTILYGGETCKFIKLSKEPRVPLMVVYGDTVKTYEPYTQPTQEHLESIDQEIELLDERISSFEKNENLTGDDWTKMYYAPINQGDVLTISSPDWSSPSEFNAYGLNLIGYNENKEIVSSFYYSVSDLPRTITIAFDYQVKYLGWNKYFPWRIKVERGDKSTGYIEYKGQTEFVFPTGWETAALDAYNACVSKMNELTCDGIPILIETDIHKNKIMLNPLQWIDNKDKRFKQINLGDNLEYADEESWDDDFYKQGKKLSNYVCLAGNHDVEITQPHLAFKNYQEIDHFYTSLNANYRRPSQRPFFVSYDDKYNVKYVITSIYYNEGYDLDNLDLSAAKKFKTAQAKWLIEELSKDDGYDIVMLMHEHVTPTGYKDRNGVSVSTSEYPYVNLWQMFKDRRNKRSGTFTDTDGVVHSYDFTNCKSNFLCSLQGHWHRELILAEDNTVSYISTTTGAIDVTTEAPTNGACTIALIDRESKHLYIWSFSADGVKNMLTLNI